MHKECSERTKAKNRGDSTYKGQACKNMAIPQGMYQMLHVLSVRGS